MINWFYNLSIRRKFTFIFGLIISFIFLGIITGQWAFQRVKVGGSLYKGIDMTRNAIDDIARIRMNVNLIRSLAYSQAIGYDETELESLNQIVQRTDTLYSTLRGYFSENSTQRSCYSCHIKGHLDSIEKPLFRSMTIWNQYKDTVENQLIPALKRGNKERINLLLKDRFDEIYYDIMNTTFIPLKDLRNSYPELIRMLKQESNMVQVFYIIAGTVFVLFLLVLSFFLSKIIVAPIKGISRASEEMAMGNFTESEITFKGNDEIAKMVRAFKGMKKRITQLVKKVKNNLVSLSQDSERLSESSNRLKDISDDQKRRVENMVSSISGLSQSIDEIACRASEAAKVSEEASELAKNGREVSEDAISNIKDILDMVNRTSDIIERLGKNTREISTITSLISEIAEQTNLLALNAAIEAARAGEHGRGFAVVAEEVRKLAEKTSKATDDITSKIKEILLDTEESINQSQRSKEEVSKGLRSIDIITQSLTTITSATEKSNKLIENISSATEIQSKTAEELVNETRVLSEETDLIVKTALELGSIAERLKNLSEDLSAEACWFKTEENQKATQQEKELILHKKPSYASQAAQA
ncbi:MAG: methyl-accepting chemotaxis protein [Nitrospirae bacterium]|nr:MAG: methyl-accepting chemotaxis protein [Nitrospirota bacterium]